MLLVDEPTRGIDVGAKRAVHAALRELASRGRALVVVSSELPELMALCDRIAVLSDGRLVATFDRRRLRRRRDHRGGVQRLCRPARAVASSGTGAVTEIGRRHRPCRDAHRGRSSPLATGLAEYVGLVGVLVALVALFGVTTDHFLTRLTFTTLANQIPALTVIAVGLTLVLIAGGIDLSVGSVMALGSAVLAPGAGRLAPAAAAGDRAVPAPSAWPRA